MGYSRNRALLEQYAARARMWRRLRSTDHVLLSFPKCGRTWLRHVLAVYQDGETGPGLDLELSSGKLLHPTVVTHAGTDLVGIRGFLPKSKLVQNVRAMANKNILFLVRDPRDAVVSFYYEATLRHRRGLGRPYTMSEFMRHEGYGISYIISFFNLVHGQRDRFRSYCLIRYEDLKTDPVVNFGRAARFLLKANEPDESFRPRLSAAIEASAFDAMRKREAAGEYNNDILRPRDPSNPASFKVRQGTVGGYRSAFSKEDCDHLDAQVRNLPPEFGYA